MSLDVALFTRGQIAERTGIPDDVLNYFARENLLRPAEGGGGKGQHRRFPVTEVNLAAILFELRERGGGNLAMLRQVAEQFREAVTFFHSLGLADPAAEARKVAGAADWLDLSEEPIVADLEWRERAAQSRQQTLERTRSRYSDQHFELARVHRGDRLQRLAELFGLIAEPQTRPGGGGDNMILFYRTAKGEWRISLTINGTPPGVFTSIAMDVEGLLFEVWRSR